MFIFLWSVITFWNSKSIQFSTLGYVSGSEVETDGTLGVKSRNFAVIFLKTGKKRKKN